MTEKAMVPRIRFKGFTDPWEQRKLGELYEKAGSGGTPSATNPDYYNGDIPFLGISDVDGRDITFTKKSITEEGLNNSTAWIVPAGAISLAMYASVGKVGIIRHDTATSQAFFNMVFLDESLRDFVYTRLEKAEMDSEWDPLISTGTQSNLNAAKVSGFEISVPSREERRSIASFFIQLDNLITLHQRKYDKLVQMKKALLDKMFPKAGECVPIIRFKGFTDPWEQRELGEVVDVCSGKDYKHLPSGDVPVYGTGGYMTSVSDALSSSDDAIGIGRKGTIDNPYILYAPFWTVDTLFYSVPRPRVDLDLAFCLFLKVDWKSKNESTGLPSLSKQSISSTIVVEPEFEEQCAIGALFRSLDSLITLHQRKLELLKSVKKSLLEGMFV